MPTVTAWDKKNRNGDFFNFLYTEKFILREILNLLSH